jgi:hypothetical protein
MIISPSTYLKTKLWGVLHAVMIELFFKS